MREIFIRKFLARNTIARINSLESRAMHSKILQLSRDAQHDVVHVERHVSVQGYTSRYLYSYLTRSKFNVCTLCQRSYMEGGITADLKMQMQHQWLFPRARVLVTLMSTTTNLCICHARFHRYLYR